MTIELDTRTVSRRRVAAGAAWALPVVAMGAAAPMAAASPCVAITLPGFTSWTTPVTTGTNSGGCAGGSPLVTSSADAFRKAWLYCDGPVGTLGVTSPYTVQTCTTFQATADNIYSLTFVTQANEGKEATDADQSAPANLVMSINGSQVWAGYTIGSQLNQSGDIGITTPNKHHLATGPGNDWVSSTWSVNHISTGSGPVTICLKWTDFPRTNPGAGDDIGITVPVVTCAPLGTTS